MKKNLLSIGIMLSMSVSAFGWGQKGHDVTAYIAEQHLTPAAKAAVEDLYDGKSLVYWANWPDNACHTPEYAYTKTWHYRNIDAGNDYDVFPRNENGDVTTAIKQQYAVLADPNASKEDKKLALILLVHFCGDIHQPMHMGHLSDLGGNQVHLKFFGKNTNLHSIWDSGVLESGHAWSHTEWANQIDRISKEEAAQIISSADPDDWGKECFGYATRIYDTTPAGSELSYDYVAEWTPLIEQQLLKGGYRLADLLNTLFDPNYTK